MSHRDVLWMFRFAVHVGEGQWRWNELLKVHAWCDGNGGMWVGPPEYR